MPAAEVRSRTMDSWPIHGHGWAVHLLQQAVMQPQAGEVALSSGLRHAYLLVGPPQVGKTTLARVFAQAVLCQGEGVRPCGRCRSCGLMGKGSHPDFRLIQPTDRDGHPDRANGTLRVEQAADIIHEASLRPVESASKFFLIQDFHTANDSFANKLLKTLEEPPPHVILCLTALSRQDVLPTIASRCQVLELRPLPLEEVRAALETQWQVEPAQAELLARLSQGRLGWAVRYLQDGEAAAARQEQLSQLAQLVVADRVERLQFAEKLASQRDDPQLFALLEGWTLWWRDVMLAQAGCLEECNNVDHLEIIQQHARQLSPQAVRTYVQTLGRVASYLRHTVNKRLALDVLLLQMPRAKAS
uniref:DNA polymerase III subunit delta' n=2 Tax=Litorilinea aerophila TaxID=1204385 RepID=A0A540V8F1_9CHLR